ncbi:type II secretion system F family protein [Thermoproteota archaeon]
MTLKYEKIPNIFINSIENTLKKWHKEYITELKEIYEESGMNTIFNDYIRKVDIITIAVFVSVSIISMIAHTIILKASSSRIIIASLALSASVAVITQIIGHIKPVYQRSQNKNYLENNIIYSLSYMSCLSSSGMPLEKIFRRVSEVEDNPPLKKLINKFLVNVNLLGLDVNSALNQMADQSPSSALTKQIASIRTTIMTSGDLKNLLLYEVQRQLQKKREKLKASVNTLVYLGEIYVTMMVVTPVLFILMITILSIMGGSFGGSSIIQLNLIIFFGLPVMAAAFIILLDQVLVIEE